MKIMSVVFFVLLLTIHVGCSGEMADRNAARNPSGQFALSNEQIVSLNAAAEKGDVVAMLKLSDHYSTARNDENLGIYWLERAGNAGDSGARKSVLEYYEQVPQGAAKKGYALELRKRWRM